MKTIKEIQEENRKTVILANNPEAQSYEEALLRELSFGCQFISTYKGENINIISPADEESLVYYNCNGIGYKLDEIKQIIGKPLTLNRVLLALENSFEGEDGCFGLNYHHGLFDSWWITLSKSSLGIIETLICKWDLTKPTLEEQKEDTQRAINDLLKENNA